MPGSRRGRPTPRRHRCRIRSSSSTDWISPRSRKVWRHGSIIESRLLELTARALAEDGKLSHFAGHVTDSGEGRWTVEAAIEVGVPAPVLSAALYARFESRGRAEFADKVLSAMRLGFGGHVERSP
jgi:6-phosphogluconate dehydrogenase